MKPSAAYSAMFTKPLLGNMPAAGYASAPYGPTPYGVRDISIGRGPSEAFGR